MKKVYQSFISILFSFFFISQYDINSFATAENNKWVIKSPYEDHETIVEMYTDLSETAF